MQHKDRGWTHPLPPPPVDPFAPLTPTSFLARFSSLFCRCSFSVSARARYSLNLLLMSFFDRSFFSSADALARQCAKVSFPWGHRGLKGVKRAYT